MALVTAAEVRGLLGLVSDEDSKIESLISATEGSYARLCGYPPASPGVAPSMESRTYVLDLAHTGWEARELDLQVYPVASITSIQQDDTLDWDDPDTVSSSSYALVRGRCARLKSSAAVSWLTIEGGNRCTFVAGYGGKTTATGAHTSSATTITVASTAAFTRNASGGGRVLIGTESVTFTGTTSTTLTGCTRGADGTTAASISDGAVVQEPIPDALQTLIVAGVKHLWDRKDTQGRSSTSTNGRTESYSDGTRATGVIAAWPDFILAGLGEYMLPRAVLG